MKENIDIEELFRSGLNNMEAEPPVGGWEAIQSKLTLSKATTIAAKTFGLGKIIGIATIAVGTGLGIGYVAFNSNTNQKQTVTNPVKQSEIQTTEITTTLPDNIEIKEINSVNKTDKIVSILEVKKGNEKQKVLVEIFQPSGSSNNSIVSKWISEEKDEYSKELIKKLLDQIEEDENTTPVNEITNTNNEVLVQKITDEQVIAGIKASTTSGVAPLSIDFSNLTNATDYEWSVNDNIFSKEATPTHVFTVPGNYVVTLKVKNNEGKTVSDKIFIEVNENESLSVLGDESQIVLSPNVFTPNGDGINDTYLVLGKNIEKFQLNIVDQNGKLVFATSDINNAWDGNDTKGKPAPEGNYICVYTAYGKDKVQHKNRIVVNLSRR